MYVPDLFRLLMCCAVLYCGGVRCGMIRSDLIQSSAIPKNIAQIRKQTEALQLRVDTNESIFVQKAIAIKGLRIAIEEKDTEIRGLKRKVISTST